jgi:hypothetical protein
MKNFNLKDLSSQIKIVLRVKNLWFYILPYILYSPIWKTPRLIHVARPREKRVL